ncbi:hypothetical protein NDU88_008940 [Pleurodeles waltl]|uniref:Uncharacterized protein n=1 Tax=Pleurodeles waltl TaxID=8319 RepID=A0AAV7PRV5_PLEWA|nr:hypothetical protein NDU88_008940 [Pleurodeles waltl]
MCTRARGGTAVGSSRNGSLYHTSRPLIYPLLSDREAVCFEQMASINHWRAIKAQQHMALHQAQWHLQEYGRRN